MWGCTSTDCTGIAMRSRKKFTPSHSSYFLSVQCQLLGDKTRSGRTSGRNNKKVKMWGWFGQVTRSKNANCWDFFYLQSWEETIVCRVVGARCCFCCTNPQTLTSRMRILSEYFFLHSALKTTRGLEFFRILELSIIKYLMERSEALTRFFSTWPFGCQPDGLWGVYSYNV